RYSAEDNLLGLRPEQFLKLRDAGLPRQQYEIGFADRHTQITELTEIVLHRRIAEQLFKDNLAADIADHRAVLWRGVIHVVGGNGTAGSGHIVDKDAGISRNMFVEMAPDKTRIGIVTAAGRESHNDPDGLASIEIRYRFLVKSRTPQCLSRCTEQAKQDQNQRWKSSHTPSGLMPFEEPDRVHL